jgi:hypothetical protein
LAASPFICGIIRGGAVPVAEQRLVASGQWSVASNKAAGGRRGAAGTTGPIHL